MPGEIREELEAAFREHSQEGGSGGNTPPAPPPAGDAAARSPAAPATAPTPPASGTGERDTSGRFAPRTPAQEQVPANGEQGREGQAQPGVAQTPAPGPQAGTKARPPVTWRPEEREGWDTLPAHTQAAISRRELEMQQALSRNDEARRFHSEVSQAIAPFQHILAAENATPAQAISSLMRTAAMLRTSPPGQKAELVADMCMQFGVDMRALDLALDTRVNGTRHPANPLDNVYQAIDRRLQPIVGFMNTFQQSQQSQQQAMMQTAESTWSAFANDPANEFANDVKDTMADLMEVAANRGQVLSLQDAYRAATLAHPTISTIVQTRQQAAGAQQQTAAARRAQEAAASIPSGGAPSQRQEDEGDGSVRSDLLASIRAVNSRQQR